MTIFCRRRWLTGLAHHDTRVLCELEPPGDTIDPYDGWTAHLESRLAQLEQIDQLEGRALFDDDVDSTLF